MEAVEIWVSVDGPCCEDGDAQGLAEKVGRSQPDNVRWGDADG